MRYLTFHQKHKNLNSKLTNKHKANSSSTYLKKEIKISFEKKSLPFHHTKLHFYVKVTLTSMYFAHC